MINWRALWWQAKRYRDQGCRVWLRQVGGEWKLSVNGVTV